MVSSGAAVRDSRQACHHHAERHAAGRQPPRPHGQRVLQQEGLLRRGGDVLGSLLFPVVFLPYGSFFCFLIDEAMSFLSF